MFSILPDPLDSWYVSVIDLVKKKIYIWCHWCFSIGFICFIFHWILLWSFIIFTLLITVGFICSSLWSFLRLKLWFKIPFSFLMWVFSALNSTPRMDLTVSCINSMFSFSCSSEYFLFSLVITCVIHGLYKSVLFSFQISRDFPRFFVVREHTLYDLNPFKFTKNCFLS